MGNARIICISDTHGQHAGLRVPDGDILIHAGDFMTYGNASREIIEFNTWLGRQPYKHKIVIAGNHDRLFESHPIPARALVTNAIYLEDSGVEVKGLKFWGSPVQPPFNNWAFNVQRGQPIRQYWAARRTGDSSPPTLADPAHPSSTPAPAIGHDVGSRNGWRKCSPKKRRPFSVSTTAFPCLTGTLQSTVCRSIGEHFRRLSASSADR